MKKLYLAMVLLLLGVLAWRLIVPVQRPQVRAAADRAGEPRLVEVLATMDSALGSGPAEVYPEVVNRPLFFKERKPPKPYEEKTGDKKPVAAPRRAGSPPRVSLKGIVKIGHETFALATLPGNRNTQRLKVGDELDGWRVSRIGSDKLVLTSRGSSKEILLREYKPVLPASTKPRNAQGRKLNGSVAKRRKPASAIRPKRTLPSAKDNP
jgi:hypothetical protein